MAKQKHTVSEIKKEINAHLSVVKSTRGKLDKELAATIQAKQDVQTEQKAKISHFVNNSIADLNSDSFVTMDRLIKDHPTISGKSLSFYRDELLDKRDSSLKILSEKMDKKIDIASFHQELKDRKSAEDKAEKEYKLYKGNYSSTKIAIPEKLETLYKLDQDLLQKGQKGLYRDTKPSYEQTNIFKAAFDFATRDDAYRQVRDALCKYGHGENGVDAFADLSKAKQENEKQITNAKQQSESLNAAEIAFKNAKEQRQIFSQYQDGIKTDDQILELVRDRVSTYIQSDPSFCTVLANEYGEDFPQDIPLLFAKQNNLDKIQTGLKTSQEALMMEIHQLSSSVSKLDRASSSARVSYDLDSYRKANVKRKEMYGQSLDQTRSMRERTQDYNPPVVIYENRGPDFFEMMMWNEIFNHHDSHVPQYNNPAPSVIPDTGFNFDMPAIPEMKMPEIPSFDFGSDANSESSLSDLFDEVLRSSSGSSSDSSFDFGSVVSDVASGIADAASSFDFDN